MARILIIEDDDVAGDVLARFLRRAGHQVDRAPTGHEAIGAVMADPPDLVVLDLSMPEMDGASVLEIIRSYLRLHSLPVVVWTGLSNCQLVDRVKELHVNSVVVKGSLDQILTAIDEALRSAPQQS